MTGVETNILVYAHRPDMSWHEPAARVLRSLAEGQAPWAIPWPCIHEFLGIVTRQSIFPRPSTLQEAIDQVEMWLESPSLVRLSETDAYWPYLRSTLVAGRITGPRVHDARIAAICRLHGVRELWSADRDFSRFPDLRVRNPLVG